MMKRKSLTVLALLATLPAILLLMFFSQPKQSPISFSSGNPEVSIESSGIAQNQDIGLNFVFPKSSQDSKIVQLGDDNSSLSIFLLRGKIFVFFSDESGHTYKPVSLPIASDGKSSKFSFRYMQDSKTVTIESGDNKHKIFPLPNFQLNSIDYIRSGNIENLSAEGSAASTRDFSLLKITIALLLSISAMITVLRKSKIFFRNAKSSKNRIRLLREENFTKFGIVSFLVGFVLILFVSPTPPAAQLIETNVSLQVLSDGDFSQYDDQLKGSWLFPNSPELQVDPDEFSSNLAIDFDFEVQNKSEFNRLLLYGPSRSTLINEKNKNLEISLTGTNKIKFKIPSGSGRNEWTSQPLEPGIHRVRLHVLGGQQVTMQVDEKLVYAMSTNIPHYLLLEPNLFVSEYLRDSLYRGNTSWTISASEQMPISYALDRLLGLFGAIAVFIGTGLISFSIIGRSRMHTRIEETQSKSTLRAAGVTTVALSILGFLLWVINLQPDRGLGWPRNTPFFLSEYRFSDFTQLFISSQYSDPYSVAGVTYPPFGLLLMDLLGFLSARQGQIIFLCAAMAVTFTCIWKALSVRTDLINREKVTMSVTFTLSFPILFALDRGNLDLIVIALILLSVWINLTHGNSYISGITFGIASAIKVYPLFLLPALLYKKWDAKFLASTAVTFFSATVFGSIRFGLSPSEGISSILFGSSGQELSGDSATRWNTSLASLSSLVARLTFPDYEDGAWRLFTSSIAIATLLLIGLFGAWYLANRNCNRTFMAIYWLCFVLLVLPSSPAYRASILLITLMFVAISGMHDASRPAHIGLLIGISLSPIVYWYFGDGATNTYSIISPLALLALIYFVFSDEKRLNSIEENNSLTKRISTNP